MLAWRKPLVLAHSPLYTTSCHLEPWICKFSDVTLLGFSLNLPSRKTTPENGWLEDDPFLFGILPIFSGKLSSFSGLWMLVPTPLVCFHLFSLVFLKPCRIMPQPRQRLVFGWASDRKLKQMASQAANGLNMYAMWQKGWTESEVCACNLNMWNSFLCLSFVVEKWFLFIGKQTCHFLLVDFLFIFFNLLARHGNAKAKFQTIRLTLTLTCLCEPDDFFNSNGMPFETMIWSNIFS